VAAALRKPGARLSGYDQVLASGALARGTYEVRVYRRTAQGWVVCPAGRPLAVLG